MNVEKTFDKEQARARYVAILEEYMGEYNRLPYAKRYDDIWYYDFLTSADCQLFDLDQEVQRNGFYLDAAMTMDGLAVTLVEMPIEQHAAFLAWQAQL